MLDLYHMPSGCSVAVKAALSLTGKGYNLIPENMQHKSAALLEANPLGKVPTLVVDGQPLFEGGAINLWLALNNPEAALMPADLASSEGAEMAILCLCDPQPELGENVSPDGDHQRRSQR